jgi:uncharacterized protein
MSIYEEKRAMLPVDSDLLKAAAQGRVDDVLELLDVGANVDASDAQGKTALIWASHRGHDVVVKVLLDAGADTDRAESQYGVTGLMLAAHHGHKHVVEVMLSHCRKDIDKVLLLAAKQGHTKIVEMIVKGHRPEYVY